MNKFAGNIVLEGNRYIGDFDFDYIETLSKTGDKILFIFGETEIKKSLDLVNSFKEKLGEFKSFDISIDSEDKMEIINDTYDEGIYELATFEGEQVDFSEILERFKDFEEVVSIREAEISEKFGNKVVKVDFVY